MQDASGRLNIDRDSETETADQPSQIVEVWSQFNKPIFDWLALALVVVFFLAPLSVIVAPIAAQREASRWRGDFRFTESSNIQILEAASWRQGKLDIPVREWDTALSEGKVYSHFPPLFTIISAMLLPLFGGVPHWFILLFIVLPVPILAYLLFRRATSSPIFGALLAIGFVCGTSAWPVMDRTLSGCRPYFVNHTLALVGLLIFLIAYQGQRRTWVAGLGLLMATMARSLTAAFMIPLVWSAWKNEPDAGRRRQWAALALICLSIVAVPLTMNTLKFGHPLKTGYMLIYEGRDDSFAQDAHEHGLFSTAFLTRNLYYHNIGLPKRHVISMAGQREVHYRPNMVCTGIWWTTPLLLWLLVDLVGILRQPSARILLLASACVYVPLMLFHASGNVQRGYNRFSLDYLPAILVLIAPKCFQGWRRWVSVAMIVWSVVYFRWMI